MRRPSLRVQPSLRVSAPHDPAEREAETVARQVMSMSAPVAAAGRLSLATLSRQADGMATGPAAGPADVAAAATGGSALAEDLRGFMEHRFRADFREVRVHTDDHAARLSNRLGARAFAYGRHLFFARDQYRPNTPEGAELIAHELTHTIQQGVVNQQTAPAPAPAPAAPVVASKAPVQVQRLGISDALDYLADKATIIPGFRMFTIVLGINPINMSRVERSAANILRALVEFMPGGALITEALDKYGVFDKAGGWIEQQIAALGLTGSAIRNAVMEFIDSLGLRDLFHLGDVWDRAKRIFTVPIDRIIGFARNVVSGIVTMVKDAILRPLAQLAQGTRGWDLLIAVLGRNPITGEAVPRTADTLIGGFMKLIGQEEVWENLKKANAVARAWAWFQGTLAGVLAFVQAVPERFLAALRSLEIADIVLLSRAFVKVGTAFATFVGDFIGWAGRQVLNLLEIIFEVLAPAVVPYIRKAAGAFQTIIRDPIRFVGLLVRAGIQGFRQFAARFLIHLRTSLVGWLTGSMAGANIYIPQAFSFAEIIKFALSVLGLTWQNIRGKLVRGIGETAVAALEAGFDIVKTLVTQGPGAAWEKIQEGITNLREMVIEQVMSFVRDNVVQAAITKLLSSLNPAGAFIQAIIATYNTIMFFVERIRQIAQVAASFIDGIASIAAGNIQNAADRVEQTMAGLLTLVISFLARIAGLGRVSDEVTRIINRVRAPIDRALDKVVDWIVATARKVGKLFAPGTPANSVANTPPGSLGSPARPADEDRAITLAAEGHTLRAHRENGQTTFLMASGSFGQVESQLQQIRNHYVNQFFSKAGMQSLADQLDARLKIIDDRLKAIKTAVQAIETEDMRTGTPDKGSPRRDQAVRSGLDELQSLLSNVSKDFVFGPGASVKPGDHIVVSSGGKTRGAIVQAVGMIVAGRQFGLRATNTDLTNPQLVTYDQYGTSWSIPASGKPAYIPFSGASGSGTRTVRIDQVPHPDGKDPGSNPPGYAAGALWNRRGHLVAKMFGGPGDPRNIVAMTFAANQTGAGMRSIEDMVRDDIRLRGAVFDYRATPIYSAPKAPASDPPDSVAVRADEVYPAPTPGKFTKSVDNTK
jgi:hypothetical protein